MTIKPENHRNQINVQDLVNMIAGIKSRYPDNWKNVPVYIGGDEELNSIHTAMFVDEINDDKEYDLVREMINESCDNKKLDHDEIAILIS